MRFGLRRICRVNFINCRPLGNIPLPNEPIETQRARLVYQSRKHGLKELEFLFNRFAMANINSMSKDELGMFSFALFFYR